MNDTRYTVTVDQKEQLTRLIRRLPAMIAGKIPDESGIAEGFRNRLGFALFSLIGPNFEDLGRGGSGADGTKWPPLTKAYLAYGRRFGQGEIVSLKKAAGLGKGHRHAPGKEKGLLTLAQLTTWRQIYGTRLAYLSLRMSYKEASARAAAIAWATIKKQGAKTKLEVFGNRVVQVLVDTGRLRGSLQPGTLSEGSGPQGAYQKPSGLGGDEQLLDASTSGRVICGTNVKYAVYHHAAKSPKRCRRLWPQQFPTEWWNQILGTAVSGLTRIGELFLSGGIGRGL